ncbi:hypothetical protein [Salmonella sp. s51944]|uniref:hypothetical protein n=1 Tax=Salmonella sp. s51944 TaxID=3159655 RepID=UPI0039817882
MVLDLKVTPVSQVMQVLLETEDQQVIVVLEVVMVLQAHVDSQDKRAHVDHQVMMVLKVKLDHQDLQDHLAHQEQCKDSPTHHTHKQLSHRTRDPVDTIMVMMPQSILRTGNQK